MNPKIVRPWENPTRINTKKANIFRPWLIATTEKTKKYKPFRPWETKVRVSHTKNKRRTPFTAHYVVQTHHITKQPLHFLVLRFANKQRHTTLYNSPSEVFSAYQKQLQFWNSLP
jgi:hypothetical protein